MNQFLTAVLDAATDPAAESEAASRPGYLPGGSGRVRAQVIVFADSSALVTRYADEPGRPPLGEPASLVVSQVARVEVPSAIWRKQRLGELSVADAALLIAAFEADYGGSGAVPGCAVVLTTQAADPRGEFGQSRAGDTDPERPRAAAGAKAARAGQPQPQCRRRTAHGRQGGREVLHPLRSDLAEKGQREMPAVGRLLAAEPDCEGVRREGIGQVCDCVGGWEDANEQPHADQVPTVWIRSPRPYRTSSTRSRSMSRVNPTGRVARSCSTARPPHSATNTPS